MINLVKKDLEEYRTDSAFEQLLSDAKLIAEELECETEETLVLVPVKDTLVTRLQMSPF